MCDFEIKLVEEDSIHRELFKMMSLKKNQIGFWGKLSEYHFLSMLYNGITYIATKEKSIVGFISFQVIHRIDEDMCIHNLALSFDDTQYDYVLQLLFKQEEAYLKKYTKVNQLISYVDKTSVLCKAGLRKSGFSPLSIYRRSAMGTEYTCVVYGKKLDGQISKLSLRRSYLKSYLFFYLSRNQKGLLSYILDIKRNLLSSSKNEQIYRNQQKVISDIRERGRAKVLFIASSMAMWKYQYLYDFLQKDNHFEVFIQLSPFPKYAVQQQKADLFQLKSYFDSHKIPYFNFEEDGQVFDVRQAVNPDIIFYTQPYNGCLNPSHDVLNFQDKLIACYPYGYLVELEPAFYNNPFQESAWKLFYSNNFQLQHAQEYALNKGRNVAVVGYPTADEFRFKKVKDPWKPCGVRKRIIWAPHFTIDANTCFTNHSNFLWMADFMLELAKKYADKIQIAFKPHPRLKTELYNHIKWGKEKTDEYYEAWNNLQNGQLETGDFVDLFLTSEAMIHDSASFCIDYMYTTRPVMYVTHDVSEYTDYVDDMGKQVMDLHYKGGSLSEIQRFVDEVVLSGEDVLYNQRLHFLNTVLLPPNGKSTAENTYKYLMKELFLS